MLLRKKGMVEWLQFKHLTEVPFLFHGVFLRRGGISLPPFASLNVGGGTGDDDKVIDANREKVRLIAGAKELISSRQAHGKNVLNIPSSSPLLETNCDGLMTKEAGLGLLIKHADCQAAIFCDPNSGAIANVHAGWRGNVQKIYRETVEKMREFFGSKPEDLLVGIGPSLGPCCAEFKNFKEELPDYFLQFQIKPFHFDLWQAATEELKEAGVLESHIEVAKICTRCHPEDYFSYRGEKITGRNGTVAAKLF